MNNRPTARQAGRPHHDGGACWSCGGSGKQAPGSAYCSTCINRGEDDPFISCVLCGALRRRSVRGQKSFTCTAHQKHFTAKELEALYLDLLGEHFEAEAADGSRWWKSMAWKQLDTATRFMNTPHIKKGQ